MANPRRLLVVKRNAQTHWYVNVNRDVFEKV